MTEEHGREKSGKRGKLHRVTTVLMLMLDIKPYVVLKTQGTFLLSIPCLKRENSLQEQKPF